MRLSTGARDSREAPEAGIVVPPAYMHVAHAADLLDRGRQPCAQLGAPRKYLRGCRAVPTILTRSCTSIARRALRSDYRHRRPDGGILPSSHQH